MDVVQVYLQSAPKGLISIYGFKVVKLLINSKTRPSNQIISVSGVQMYTYEM